MPRGRKPESEHALSNAERQARHRARHVTQPAPVVTRVRRATDRRSRPQRWRDAVSELLAQAWCRDPMIGAEKVGGVEVASSNPGCPLCRSS